MSFILEALKKSEKNRQQNSVPTLDTQHRSTEPQPRKRALWPLLLLAVLLINAGVLLWLFGPWHNAPAPAAPQPAAPIAAEVAVPATPLAAAPTPPQVDEPTAVSPSSAAVSRPQPVTVSAVTTTPPQPLRPSTVPELIDEEAAMAPPRLDDPDRLAFEPQPAPVRVTPPVSQPAAAAAVTLEPVSTLPATAVREIAPPDTIEPVATTARIYAINELPSHLRQQLPRLHMSVHAYSEGGGGLIRLNDKIMRVGSYLDGRYRLEEITPDGAVFSVQGTHFLVPRKGL